MSSYSVDGGNTGASGFSANDSMYSTGKLATTTTAIVRSNGGIVYASKLDVDDANLFVGRGVEGEDTRGNMVFGQDILVKQGVENSVSLGRNYDLEESNTFYVGDFLTYRQEGDLRMADNLIRANTRAGEVRLGQNDDFKVTRSMTSIASPLQINSRNRGAVGKHWQIGVETSDEDPLVQDLVLRAADGTAVVFGGGAGRA